VGNPPDQLKCQGTGRETPSCSAMLLPAIPTYKGAVDSSLGRGKLRTLGKTLPLFDCNK